MTAKAVTIGSDSIRPSDFARNLNLPANPLHSFKELSIRKQAVAVLILIAATIGVMLAVSQVFGAGEHKDNMNSSNTSNTSSSSNQQPHKDNTGQPSASSNTGTTSNSNSTSITVNGQSIDVPQTGSYDKNVNVSGSNVHVSGNTSQSTTGGSATNSSSTNVEINSE